MRHKEDIYFQIKRTHTPQEDARKTIKRQYYTHGMCVMRALQIASVSQNRLEESHTTHTNKQHLYDINFVIFARLLLMAMMGWHAAVCYHITVRSHHPSSMYRGSTQTLQYNTTSNRYIYMIIKHHMTARLWHIIHVQANAHIVDKLTQRSFR